MSIETTQDIASEIADVLGIYGEDRCLWETDLMDRMREAVHAEDALAEDRREQWWADLAERMERAFEKYEQRDSY